MKSFSYPWEWITQYHKILLAIVLFSGLLLRLYGIDYELPYLYHSDEGLLVKRAGLMLENRDLNPHWFFHPGTTIIYILCVLFTLIFLIGLGLGSFETPDDFRTFFFQDPTVFYLSGRITFAVLGVVSLLIVWLIARRLFNQPTALIAVVFFALNPLHVYHSKLIRPDVLLTLLILVSFWFCTEILKKRTWSAFILAGLFSGLAIATKYPAVISVLLIVIASILNRPWQRTDLSKLLVSCIGGLLGVFIGSPFLFLDFGTVLSHVAREARPRHLSATGEGLLQNLAWYVQNSLLETLTIVGLILVGIGIVLCLASQRKDKWLLVTFPVIFTVFIAALNLRWARWIIPIVPFLCILSAHAWYWTMTKMGELWHPRIGRWVSFILLLGIVIPLLKVDIRQGREMSGTDTRTLAREWILDNIPPGSRLLIEEWASQLPKERYKFFIVKGGELTHVDASEIDLAAFRPKGKIGLLKDIKALHREKIEYMVLSNWYNRYLAEKEKYTDYAESVATYEALMKTGRKLYEVKRVPGKNRGSTIRIYRLISGH